MSLNRTLKVLSEDGIERILENAYLILEQKGIAVHNKQLRDLLSRNGAKVEDEQVRMPRQLIGESLKLAPHSFPVSDRAGGRRIMEQGAQHLCTMSDAIDVYDGETDSVRSATEQDLSDLTVLADSLPEVDFAALQVVPAEKKGLPGQLNAMRILLSNTTKPLFLEPLNAFITETWVEIEHLLQQTLPDYVSPSIVMVITTLSPLQLDDASAQKLLIAAKNNIPILTAPCPIAGITSPFTLAGSLVQSVAETLFEAAAAQLINESCPLFFGAASTVMDVKTGTITYGAPEFALLMAAYAEMAAYFNLPSYIPVIHPDADEVDVQMGAEMMLGFMTLLGCRPTIMPGIGALNKTGLASVEKLVIDAELYRMAQRIYEGINVTETSLAYDSINSLQQGETYLTDELTLRELRSGEHYIPHIINREERATGALNMRARAREHVRSILDCHRPDISDNLRNELERFFAKKCSETVKHS